MPTPEELEVAELFLRKAASDLSAARSLARDADQHDDVVGFHAQQAVEKSLKAVLDRGAALEVAENSLIWAPERVESARGEEDVG